MASFTFAREIAAPPEIVFEVLTDHRRYADDRRRCAGPSSSARATRRRTGSARSGSCTAVGPPLREEVIIYEPSEPLLLQAALRAAGARPRRHRRADPDGEGTRVVYVVRMNPTLPVVGRAVVAGVRQGVKQLLNGVASESERRAAASA